MILSQRWRQRLARHHLPLALAVGATGTLLYVTRPYDDVIARLSFASAYPALALLSWTLLIGPWRALRRRPYILSSDFRRDIGIWAGATGLFHAAVGQFVHLRGRPWLYYVYEPEDWAQKALPLRYDLFGFSNHTGLLAALVLAMLLATSGDWAVRRLGGGGWKRLQRWNYACFALTAVHTAGYMWSGRPLPFVTLAVACGIFVMAVQIAGWRRNIP